jgi:soluble lytic murein transglycosylase
MRINALLSIIFVFLLNFATLANNGTSRVFQYIQNKEWTFAEKLAGEIGDPTLLKIVLSQKFLDKNYTDNKFEEIVAFIQKNPNWPQIDQLKIRAEESISNSTDKAKILSRFSRHKPQTPTGHKYYALAAGALIKDKAKLSQIIKNGWVYGNFGVIEEKKYLQDYGAFLTKDDHLKRINECFWQKQSPGAKRIYNLADSNYKAAFEATVAAIENRGDKDVLFQKVNPKFYTTSLIYYYLTSKKTQKPSINDIKLFKKINHDRVHSKEWAQLQLYYAREFIDYKDFASSYNIIKDHFADDPENMREAEWLAGFLALRFLKKPELALAHFNKLSEVSKKPISIARSKYWAGRSYAALKDQENARINYRAASIYPYTYYGQLALIELKNNKLALPATPKIDREHEAALSKNEILQAAKLWIKYGCTETGHAYAKAAMEIAKTPGEAVLIARMIKNNNQLLYYTVDIAKAATYQNAFIAEYAYPTPYNLKNTPVEAALSYAVIRQESVFHPHCKSHAGAMGLMQMIKDTACVTAKSLGIKCHPHKLTQDPGYNILLGTNHLKDLLKKRKGSYVLTIASYNANPVKVDRWMDLFGDPRNMSSIYQVIDWIELIPFAETRNYVQRVLENVQVYRVILNKNNILKLRNDLVMSGRV